MIDNDASPCVFHNISGYYCPGCGGTHSIVALLMGHPIISAILNPFPMYVLLMLTVVLIRGLVCLFTKRRFTFPDAWLWGMLAVVVLNFAIKDIVLFLGFDIIQYAENLMYL